eukprot:1268063-Amphidinium_carterae.1
MPLSGRVPLKPFLQMKNMLTARITWSPMPGSAPSMRFVSTEKSLTALIARTLLSGIVPLK